MSRASSPTELAGSLYRYTKEMGDHHSNPVLELLGETTAVRENKKYPEPPLTFADQDLRAYYHCHAAVDRPRDEHGHFHIFIRPNVSVDNGWAHLAGLSMDHFGQPRQWFAVNRWVTGGDWLARANCRRLLNGLTTNTAMSVVEAWLIVLLQLYQDELIELLAARDRCLIQIKARHGNTDIFENREIYTLATCPIDLMAKLRTALAGVDKRTHNRN